MTVTLVPGSQRPQPVVPMNTYVSMLATVSCTGEPLCDNPLPPGQRFYLRAYTGTDGWTESDTFDFGPPLNIRFICNSFDSCRIDNQPLMLQARLVDAANNVLLESDPVLTNTNFVGSSDAPPTADWYPDNPSVLGRVVTIKLRYTDPDDLPTRLENVVVSALENGRPASIYSGSNTQWTRAASTGVDTLLQTFTYTCNADPCSFPIKLTAQGRDPSGSVSMPLLEFTLNSGPPIPPPSLSILRPPEPICVNSVIRAQADSSFSPVPIKSHEYRWYANLVLKKTDVVQDDDANKITSGDFNCLDYGCLPTDMLGVEAVAIDSGGRRSMPSPRINKPLVADPLLCAPPLPPDVTYVLEPVISATASQTMPPTVVRHTYIWTLPSGEIVENDISIPPGITSTQYRAPCDAVSCPAGSTLRLEVCSFTAADVMACALPLSIYIPALSSLPFLTTEPAVPDDNQSFVIKVHSNDEVDAHEYNLTVVSSDGTVLPQIISRIVNPADRHNSQISFQCTRALCRGSMVYIYASAHGVRGWSPIANIAFGPKLPIVVAPEVKSIIPEDTASTRLRDIKRGVSAVIKNTESYTITLGPPSGMPSDLYDSYKVEMVVNGAPVAAVFNKAGGNVVITLSCTPTSCPDGAIIRYQVRGVSDGVDSQPAGFALVVPAPSGIPAQLPVLCDQGEIFHWLQIMAIGMGLIIGIIALVYMIGNAMHNPQMLDWSKSELANLLVTVLFFMVIVWLISMQCTLQIGELLRWTGFATLSGTTWSSTHPLYKDGAMTMSQASLKELEWAIQQTYLTTSAIRYEMGAGNMRATYSSYTTQVPALGGNGYSFTPLAGDYTTLGSLGMLLNLNSTFVIALLLQLFSVFFFSASAGLFAFLVPAGLLLRSVPFMRGFGGSLVAIGVGFYLFYPMMLALTGYVLAPLYMGVNGAPGIDASDKLGISSAMQLNEDATTPIGIEGASIASYNPFNPYPGYLKRVVVGCKDLNDNSCPVDIGLYFNLTAINFLRAILVPSAGIIVGVAFVRDLSVLFGEEVDASKLIAMI